MTDRDEIIDNLKIVCQCKRVAKGVFKKIIAQGGSEPARILGEAGAGNGYCQGKRCLPRIERMLAEQGNRPGDKP